MLTRGGLEIRCLGLNQTSVNVCSAGETILIDDVVFSCGTNQPDVCALDEEATASEDINLSLIGIVVQLMVSGP